jgi:predicted nucleotide-binding protein
MIYSREYVVPPKKPLPKKYPAGKNSSEDPKREYLSQTDVPNYGLNEALKVPSAIVDAYASAPTRPFSVAKAMNLSPTSASFRQRCGSAIAYGLTDGGAKAELISLTPLAKRILSPTVEGDDLAAKREAFLKPRVIGLFLTKYDSAKFPRRDIAENVLVEMGIPKDSVKHSFDLIVEGANELGLLAEINGNQYVNLQGVKPAEDENVDVEGSPASSAASSAAVEPLSAKEPDAIKAAQHLVPQTVPGASRAEFRKKRVFITHGKEKGFIDPIKKLLGFGELEAVVSVERQTVSLSVPDKVMNDMRSCGAAIIHVDAEIRLTDVDGKDHVFLNPNVLIEIGAAMSLYGRRFILLVKEGAKLPSNLQGLYEVRYSGDALDGVATIKLLESINDIKNHPLPD